MKKSIILTVLFISILSSCSITNNLMSVNFELPDDAIARGKEIGRDSSETQFNEPNELLICEIQENEIIYSTQSLDEGDNTIDLEKDKLYFISLCYNPNQDVSSNISYIQTVGNIGFTNTGLDTFPVSEDAEDMVNLGTLSLTNGIFSSDISEDLISASFGVSLDTILGFGKVDEVISKIQNIDINRDGTYDFDQELDFVFQPEVMFKYSLTEIDYYEQNNTSALLDSIKGSPDWALNLTINTNEVLPAQEDAALYYWNDDSWQLAAYTDSFITNEYGSNQDDGYTQYGFGNGFLCEEISGTVGPWDGDYKVVDGDSEFYFCNLRFFTPQNSEYFTFPFYTLSDTNENGLYDTLQLEWNILTSETLTPINDEAVSLYCKSAPVICITDNTGQDLHKIETENYTGAYNVELSYVVSFSDLNDLSKRITLQFFDFSNTGFYCSF